MRSTSYVNIFISTSTLLFSKPRRKKKRFKDEAEADKQTLPTLVPLVTCFDCIMVEETGRNERNQLIKRIQKINCINLSRKSMLIIHIEKEVYFIDIKMLEKLLILSKGYCFYEQNKKLKENHQLKRGIHYIRYRCVLKGD
jgi:hypothetical protein